MTFGEKIKVLRNTKNLQQKELAALLGVSLRTISGWEAEGRFPKKREIYKKLADVLECDINYLLTQDESFILAANEQYGSRGSRQAQIILEQASAMFAGGDLSDEDKILFMDQIQQMYLDSKKKSKKFVRIDYRKESE